MGELKPGRQKAVLDRRLRMVRVARDLGNYMEGWKKSYEAYIKALFESQGADVYNGKGVSATYKPVPRQAIDPRAAARDYSWDELAEKGLLSIGKDAFCNAYGLSDDELGPYLAEEGNSRRLDIKVEPLAASRLRKKLDAFTRSFEAYMKRGRKKGKK